MKPKILLTVLAGALALANSVRAEQSGSGHYISGSTADFSTAAPDIPGWVFYNFFLCYDNARASGGRGLPFGGFVGSDIKAQVYAEAPTVFYTPPFKLLDGFPAFAVSIPYTWVEVKASAITDTRLGSRSGSKSDSANGLGDIQVVPFMLGWTNGDFKYDFRTLVWAPTGEYNKGQLANVGLGYWTFTPMATFTWLSSKIGTEFSVFTGVDFNTENTEADYKSGNIFHIDATLAQHLPLAGGFVGLGANAFYLKQFTGDSGSGATLGAFEAESYGVGPVVSYMHKFGDTTLILDASWLPQLAVENTTKGNFIWFKLGLVF